MKQKIALIDTGSANLHSVHKAFEFIGKDVEITRDTTFIQRADAVVFPGIGAFGAVMECIEETNLQETIKTVVFKKPFLGICMGLQVLFEKSEENSKVKGLDILKGEVIRFKRAKVVPHVGWNDVIWNDTTCQYYFVHSFYVVPKDKNIIFGETEYDGERFTSAIKKDNLFAVQFHPEKSGEAGLELLNEFVKTI